MAILLAEKVRCTELLYEPAYAGGDIVEPQFGGDEPQRRPAANHAIVKKGYDRLLPNRNRSEGCRSAIIAGTELSYPENLKVTTLTDAMSLVTTPTQSCGNLEAAAFVQRATYRYCFSRSAPPWHLSVL